MRLFIKRTITVLLFVAAFIFHGAFRWTAVEPIDTMTGHGELHGIHHVVFPK